MICVCVLGVKKKKKTAEEEKKNIVSSNRVTRDLLPAPWPPGKGWQLSAMLLLNADLPWRHSDQAGQIKRGGEREEGSKTIISNNRRRIITLNNSHRAEFAPPLFRSR